MTKKILTLCLILQDDKLLLGMKKRGFGAGWWNGFGGKVEKNESIEEAAKRELQEEVGIELLAAEQQGILTFKFESDLTILEVHVFRVTKFTGEPIETEEMKPQWFAISDIPYDQMWADDRYWLPLFLTGKKFRGHFYFRDNNHLLKHEVEEFQGVDF